MPTAKRLSRSLGVVGPNQQIRRIESGIHATSIVRSNGGFNLHRVQDPSGDLGIRDGSEGRKNDEVCSLHSSRPLVRLHLHRFPMPHSPAYATVLPELFRISGLEAFTVDVRIAAAQAVSTLVASTLTDTTDGGSGRSTASTVVTLTGSRSLPVIAITNRGQWLNRCGLTNPTVSARSGDLAAMEP